MRPRIKIGAKSVGPGGPVYFIAEIGSNHDGSLERAKRLVAESAEAGADAVKFQSFTADGLCAPRLRDGGGWKENPVWRAFKGRELPPRWLKPLSGHCRKLGVDFLSTPFDSAALKALVMAGAPAVKLASGDLTYLALLREAAGTGKPLLIATGMADLAEVRRAVEAVRGAGGSQVALLHCVSLYPPRFEEMNLRAVAALSREFGCPVGLSDHGPGHAQVLGAVALGAAVVEKHVTLDRKLKGPDHSYALEIAEFAAMVQDVRRLEAALGDGVKRPAAREAPERTYARRGLYAARAIKAGGAIEAGMVGAVRPALGIPADQIDRVLGSVAARDIGKDEPLLWEALAPHGA